MHPRLNLSVFKSSFEEKVAKEFTIREGKRKKNKEPFAVFMKVTPKYLSHNKKDDASYRPTGVTSIADFVTLGPKGKLKVDKIRPGFLDNPESVPEEKLILLNKATSEELAAHIPGIGASTAAKLESALESIEISRTSQLDQLAEHEGIGEATVRKLKEKRARRKLKYYEMEEI
jgi:DNA uptake protein ComE-like DNA-binding protein